MTAEQVLLLKDSAPFRPFQMCLEDGRVLLVPHPDFLTVAEDDQPAHLYDSDDGIETVDLLLVVSVRSPAKTVARASA
jgi:hypothetical protein